MKKASTSFTASDVDHISHLAKIPVTDKEKKKLAAGFNTTLSVVETLSKIETKGVLPTDHVTGLVNVYREDEVDTKNVLPQKKVLSNSKHIYKGFFAVEQVLDK